MKITDIKLYTYNLSLINGKTKEGIIIEVFDDLGNKGTGEVSPLLNWSHESFKDALDFTINLKNAILSGNFSPFTLPPSVMFGMQSALNQLICPLKSDLTFEKTKLIFNYKENLSGPVKLKLGNFNLQSGIKIVEKLLSQPISLRLDFNRKWKLEDTIEFCQHFAPNNFVYLEEPVINYSDIAKFYEKTNFSFALDEHLLQHPIEDIITNKGLTHLIIKPSLHGGITQCQELQNKAGNIKCIFSSAYETSVGLSNIVKIANTLSPNTPIGIDTLDMLKTDILNCPSPLNENILKKDIFNNMPLNHKLLKPVL